MSQRPLTSILICCSVLATVRNSRAEDGPDFTRDVWPIFQTHCVACHDAANHNGGLNLVDGLIAGSESGAVVVPGQPDQSLLLRLVSEGSMPPEKADRLTADEVTVLKNWISAGARLPGTEQFPTVVWSRIQALLLLRCAVCHGADRQEGGLDLRTRESLLRGGQSGPAVIPGQPDASLLLQKITSAEMPPVRRLVEVSIKPITSAETQLLRDWIVAGMPGDPAEPPTSAAIPPDAREFWSFKAPRAVTLPQLDDQQRVQTPIDAFVLQRLEQHQLTLAPAAEPAVLIRRLYLDLTGLPPTWAQLQEVLNDPAADRYSKLIDRLLDSPHYGIRWARFWLDAAGYADSEGAQNEDRVRREMWRYRDYVIRAFNTDKPWDRFLQEQLAGDELGDYINAPEIDQTLCDNLIATGFLRTAPDRTFANITAFVPDRLEVIADELQILGSAVMGLTIGCARCHSHKFDPIPQADYYRLAAIFRDALDEHDWLRPEDQRTLPYVTTAERTAWEQQKRQIEQQLEAFKPRIEAAAGDAKTQLQQESEQLRKSLPPEPRIRALWSRGRPSPTWVLLRGDYLTPGKRVQPGVPEVLSPPGFQFQFEPPWPGAEKTGARLAFARWLTQPDHPLTARVIVNRIWMHHFGRGLVDTPGNFGVTGSPPSHPELLDWLAMEFVRSGWSIKSLHRLILNSAVWQQSSAITPEIAAADPEGRLLSRMPMRRMDAETLRDSLLFTSGALSEEFYGPADAVEVRSDGLVTVKPRDGRWRRSIFALMRRTQIPSLLESFDYPQMGPNCLQRSESLTAPQSLQLLNSSHVHELSQRLSASVLAEAGQSLPLAADPASREHRVRLLARRIYCREPADDVQQLLLAGLRELAQEWEQATAQPAALSTDSTATPEDKAFQNLCHALLNSAAFSTIE
jgi:mono/diheme cytochrome c family protein